MTANLSEDFLCIAHRGARGYEPENTLLAISKALELGAKWIEVDVHYANGHLLVLHDAEMTTPDGTHVDIAHLDFESLRSVDLGKGQRIPTLREVLDTVGGSAKINIELKGPGTARPTCSLLDTRFRTGAQCISNVLVSSFRYEELSIARALLPSAHLAVLAASEDMPYLETASRLSADYVNVGADMVTRDLVKAAKARGVDVLVFTVNSVSQMRWLRDIGVAGVFTDYIDLCDELCGGERR